MAWYFPPAVYTMYCIRLSTLRKYTFAALKGAYDVTVPETLANPDNSEPPPWVDCAAAFCPAGNAQHTVARSTTVNHVFVRFMTVSFCTGAV